MKLRISPPEEILETTVESLPLSKSVAARALVMNALTPGAPPLTDERMPKCDDIAILRQGLMAQGETNLHDSGTALRFLTAFYAAWEGCEIRLTGSERLCSRPIGALVDALRQLGADIEYEATEGCAPLRIRGRRLVGGKIKLDASLSSQYASALLMLAPTMAEGLEIDFGGEYPSRPYLIMTETMLRHRGIDASVEGYTARVAPGTYRRIDIEAEPDWSAAAFWYEIVAATAGWATLPGFTPDSMQGDSILTSLGERIGVCSEFTDEGLELSASPEMYSRLDLDMSAYPDLVPALAVTAVLIGIPFQFTGIAHLRHKESDRLTVLVKNLRRLGIVAELRPDGIGWEGEREPVTIMPEIDPCGDHRMAMAFAPVAIAIPGIIIDHAEVVAKSYPGFFDDLSRAGFTCEQI